MEYTGQSLINQTMHNIGEGSTNTGYRELVLDWLQLGLDQMLLELQGFPYTQFKNTFDTIADQQEYTFSLTNLYTDEIISGRLTATNQPLEYIEYSELSRSYLDLSKKDTPQYFFNLGWDNTSFQSKISLYPTPSLSDLEIEILYRIKSYKLADTTAVIPFPRHILSVLVNYGVAKSFARSGDYEMFQFNMAIFEKQLAILKTHKIPKADKRTISGNELSFKGGYGNGQGIGRGLLVLGNNPGISSLTLNMPNIFTVSGSPLLSGGTIGVTLANQTQKKFFASPVGETGQPSFRIIDALDLPTHQHVSSDITDLESGSGTVTSVAMSVPSIFSITGSPITTTGTLGLSLANQSANTFFAGPGTGSPATPAFRPMVFDDLPDLTGAITNDMLVGSIANAKLSNSTISGVALGGNLSDLTVDNTTLGLDSGTTYNGGSSKTISLKNTAVTPGSYTNADLTVDQQGRITSISNGSGASGDTVDILQILSKTVEVASSTTETTLETYTLPGGTLGNNGRLRISGAFRYTNNAGVGNLTWKFRFKIAGSTWHYDTGFFGNGIVDALFPFEWYFSNIDSQSVNNSYCRIHRLGVSANTSSGDGAAMYNVGNPDFQVLGTSLPNVDTSSDKAFSITAELSINNANCKIRIDNISFELITL